MSALLTRSLGLLLLLVTCVSVFIPTHTLDQVMMTTEGYLWGSNVDMSGRPLLDLALVLQPLTLLVIAVACLWTLRTGRTPALLVAVGAFQAVLVLTGMHAYAVDGGSWRGLMRKPFFDVLQLVAVLFLAGAAALHHHSRRAGTT